MPIFSPAQKAFFEKNLQALKNTRLRTSLAELTHSKFKALRGINELDFNLVSTGG